MNRETDSEEPNIYLNFFKRNIYIYGIEITVPSIL